MNAPRIEWDVTFAANQTGTIDYNGGGAVAWSIAAGTYSPSELLAALAAEWTDKAGATVTVTPDFAARGDGRVVIAAAQTIAIVFSTTPLRDVLTFTGNLAAATSHTTPKGMQGVWLPGCSMIGIDLTHRSEGQLRRDQAQVANRGHVFDWPSATAWRSFRTVQFRLVDEGRAVEGGDPDGILFSWEEALRVCLTGDVAHFPLSAAFQVPVSTVYFDTEADEVLGDAVAGDGRYRMILDPEASLPMPTEGYPGLRTVEIGELVKVPA